MLDLFTIEDDLANILLVEHKLISDLEVINNYVSGVHRLDFRFKSPLHNHLLSIPVAVDMWQTEKSRKYFLEYLTNQVYIFVSNELKNVPGSYNDSSDFYSVPVQHPVPLEKHWLLQPSPILTAPSYTQKEIVEDTIDPSDAAQWVPGLLEKVKNPVNGVQDTVQSIIINLNDAHKWTREAIADWLESLDVDLEFKTGDVNNE
jgi:hypothetical protein